MAAQAFKLMHKDYIVRCLILLYQINTICVSYMLVVFSYHLALEIVYLLLLILLFILKYCSVVNYPCEWQFGIITLEPFPFVWFARLELYHGTPFGIGEEVYKIHVVRKIC